MEQSLIKRTKWQSIKGIMISILGGLFLHFSKIFSKYAIIYSPEGAVSTFHINTFRSATLVLICLFLPRCIDVSYHDVSARKVLCIRSFAGYSAALAMYAALKIIPFSQIQIICQMAPVFMVVMGPCFLNEKGSWIDLLGLILSLVGLIVYANPGGIISTADRSEDFQHGQNANSLAGLLLGLYASFAASIVITTLSALKSSIHPTAIAFYYGLMGVVISPAMMIALDSERGSTETMGLVSLGLLILCGASFTIGTQLLAYSFHFQKAARIAMFAYLQTVYGFFFDVVLFSSVLRWNDYLSGLLIVAGTFLVSLMKAMGRIK